MGLKTKLFGLVLLLILCALAVAWFDANAKGGPERADICRPVNAHKWNLLKDHPLTSYHPEKGDFLVDAGHPCPPADIVPQPTPDPDPGPSGAGTRLNLPVVIQDACRISPALCSPNPINP